MASKYHLVDSSLYYEHSEVPINKYDIQDAQTIHEIEKELLEEAYTIFFDELSESTVFDEAYFKSLHKRVFGTLYDWAGEYRDFNMSKGDSRFCQGAFVESESKKIFEKLKQDNYLKDYEEVDRTTFVKKLAYDLI